MKDEIVRQLGVFRAVTARNRTVAGAEPDEDHDRLYRHNGEAPGQRTCQKGAPPLGARALGKIGSSERPSHLRMPPGLAIPIIRRRSMSMIAATTTTIVPSA